ncbi:collagen alpha-1(XIII) chain-like [Ammospiza nelsoni]|uniref:collagen alpha-1(XIII) chain-like n=1 Tax=Ammospiza nelsoni TaxID=2857394 RepID=UPI00286B4897|nr:collagen alpha-1(XIII) chain-like [Ammospiza nelsoni]
MARSCPTARFGETAPCQRGIVCLSVSVCLVPCAWWDTQMMGSSASLEGLSRLVPLSTLGMLYPQDREGMLEEKSWKGVDEAAFDRGCVAPPRSGDGERCCRLPLLLGSGLPGVSLLSLVLSLLLYFRTSELQSRVSHLEADRPTQLPAWLSADQMETAILGRVDQLLNEKLKFHLPRHREVRDTHQRCNCPAGVPHSPCTLEKLLSEEEDN